MHKYYVYEEKVENSKSNAWRLMLDEDETEQSFESLELLVNHLKQDKEKFSVLECYMSGIAYFENGEVTHITSEYGNEDDYMRKHWMGIEPDDDLEEYQQIDCHRCGDGGCVHCDPNFFL